MNDAAEPSVETPVTHPALPRATATSALTPLLILTGSLLILISAFCLEVRTGKSGQRNDVVTFRWGSQRTLPSSCASRTVLGMDCPGCGLTRSFVWLAQGDFRHSLQSHRLGWLVALSVLAQVPLQLTALRQSRRGMSISATVSLSFLMTVLAIALIGNWCLERLGV